MGEVLERGCGAAHLKRIEMRKRGNEDARPRIRALDGREKGGGGVEQTSNLQSHVESSI